jgi:hypothetical protein
MSREQGAGSEERKAAKTAAGRLRLHCRAVQVLMAIIQIEDVLKVHPETWFRVQDREMQLRSIRALKVVDEHTFETEALLAFPLIEPGGAR